MDRNHLFYAFLATLLTLVVVVLIAAYLAYHGKYAEALGVGGVLTGLVALAVRLTGNGQAGNTQADSNLATMIDRLPPSATVSTPARPLEGDERS